jgi:hypothetical protein
MRYLTPLAALALAGCAALPVPPEVAGEYTARVDRMIADALANGATLDGDLDTANGEHLVWIAAAGAEFGTEVPDDWRPYIAFACGIAAAYESDMDAESEAVCEAVTS